MAHPRAHRIALQRAAGLHQKESARELKAGNKALASFWKRKAQALVKESMR